MGFPIDIMKSAVCHRIVFGTAMDGRSHCIPGSGLRIGLGHVVWLQYTIFCSDNGFNMGFPIDIMKSAVCHRIGLGTAIDGRSHGLPGSGLRIGLGHVVCLQYTIFCSDNGFRVGQRI